MTGRAGLRWAWLLALLLLGCVNGSDLQRQLLARPRDYDQYRAFRTAEAVDAKLAAAWRYLKAEPNGRYRDEVRSWFLDAERRYRAAAHRRIDLLRRYLAAVPDAPSSALARERIAELELAQLYARRREARLGEQAREFEAQLSEAQRLREAFLQAVADWIGGVLRLPAWHAPVEQQGAAFVTSYLQTEPLPDCTDSSCTKRLSYPYAVPEVRRLIARRAEFSVTLELERGNVRRVVIAGPALFDRIAEASERAAVSANDALARTEAIGRAVLVLGAAVEFRLPAASCNREVVSPVVLRRECDGLRVTAVAAEVGQADDRVEVEPTTSPSVSAVAPP